MEALNFNQVGAEWAETRKEEKKKKRLWFKATFNGSRDSEYVLQSNHAQIPPLPLMLKVVSAWADVVSLAGNPATRYSSGK